ncbi:alanine racemase [Trinickia symbiotica]|uniref:Alanine racemase n=2 Tax=Trinickia symbiotica TaxID=863227 RepID=A0A2N7WQA1_9BURK|nr:alanine racemase [Trinickia symbiotica]
MRACCPSCVPSCLGVSARALRLAIARAHGRSLNRNNSPYIGRCTMMKGQQEMPTACQRTVTNAPQWARSLPADVRTPCFVVDEEGVIENLRATARVCGGIERLMPHVKTHRAGWIVELCLREGVRAFKTATIAETAMVLAAGAPYVVWAYPSLNKANIRALLQAAQAHPQATIGALVDSHAGFAAWREVLSQAVDPVRNLTLIVDLDPGMGRTGMPLDESAIELAHAVNALDYFGGWHVYDGHIQGSDADVRRKRIGEVMRHIAGLLGRASAEGLSNELIAGGSYSFDVWPASLAKYVGPGSWTYSSAQHDEELPDREWRPSAFVLATVIATKGATATLDAGAKAISPDKPVTDRFRWPGKIMMMSEEHVVVENAGFAVGDRVLLLPRHACTTAYLYQNALVLARNGEWTLRAQLGSQR